MLVKIDNRIILKLIETFCPKQIQLSIITDESIKSFLNVLESIVIVKTKDSIETQEIWESYTRGESQQKDTEKHNKTSCYCIYDLNPTYSHIFMIFSNIYSCSFSALKF